MALLFKNLDLRCYANGLSLFCLPHLWGALVFEMRGFVRHGLCSVVGESQRRSIEDG